MSKNKFMELYAASPLLAVLRAQAMRIPAPQIELWELYARATVARSIH